MTMSTIIVTPQLITTITDFIPERGWTGDIPICSRMLYHWDIPPLPQITVSSTQPLIRIKRKNAKVKDLVV